VEKLKEVRKMGSWVVVSWWVFPEEYPEMVHVETDGEGRAKLFHTRERAERWARENLQKGMWKAVEI
jgi:hypothetical protein